MTVCLDARVVAEYREVLLRPKFGFDRDAVATLLDYLDSSGELVAGRPLTTRLPDLDDEAFLEVALAANADCLVTGNLVHYPPEARAGVVVLPPSGLVERYRATLAELELGD